VVPVFLTLANARGPFCFSPSAVMATSHACSVASTKRAVNLLYERLAPETIGDGKANDGINAGLASQANQSDVCVCPRGRAVST
jgi:hypothetical protein